LKIIRVVNIIQIQFITFFTPGREFGEFWAWLVSYWLWRWRLPFDPHFINHLFTCILFWRRWGRRCRFNCLRTQVKKVSNGFGRFSNFRFFPIPLSLVVVFLRMRIVYVFIPPSISRHFLLFRIFIWRPRMFPVSFFLSISAFLSYHFILVFLTRWGLGRGRGCLCPLSPALVHIHRNQFLGIVAVGLLRLRGGWNPEPCPIPWLLLLGQTWRRERGRW